MRAPCAILCLIGLYLSVLLLQLQTNSSGLPGIATSICEKVGGCDQVLESKWAFFPPVEQPAMGESPTLIQEYAIPVAVLGLVYFSGLLIWFLFIGRSSTLANTVVLILGLLSCLISVWFLYLIFRVVDASCPFCLILHVVNFMLFGSTLIYFFKEDSDTYQPRALYGATGLAILTLWTAIGFGWRARSVGLENVALTGTLASIQSDIDNVEMVWRAENPVEILIREKVGQFSRNEFDPILQALPGFRNTVVIVGDAQDPTCAQFSEFLLDQVRPYFGGHMRVVWKHFPAGDNRSSSWMAARALEAARIQGKFWPFLRLLFEEGNRLEGVDYQRLAADCGMNPEQFDRDWRSAAVQKRIDADIAGAKKAGVGEAPTVFLNSRRVDESIRGLTGFWKLQASRLKSLRTQKAQGWGDSGAGGMASGGNGFPRGETGPDPGSP